MQRLLSILIATLLVSSSAVAFADQNVTPGDDEIRLKDGGMLRGTIVAVEPGKEATIIVKGKEKTISWSKIEKVEQGKYKAEEDEAPTKPKKVKQNKKEQSDGDEEMDEPKKGAPSLHISSTYPGVQLTRVEQVLSVYTSRGSATGIVTRGVCAAPCDEVIDGRDGAQFFFTAPSMVASSPFTLNEHDGSIEARVRGGSAGLRIGSYLVGSAGLVGIIMGPLLMSFESSRATYDTDPINPNKPYQPNYGPGIGLIAVGVGAVAAGVVMFIASRTTVEFRPRTEESAGIRFENGVLRF